MSMGKILEGSQFRLLLTVNWFCLLFIEQGLMILEFFEYILLTTRRKNRVLRMFKKEILLYKHSQNLFF